MQRRQMIRLTIENVATERLRGLRPPCIVVISRLDQQPVDNRSPHDDPASRILMRVERAAGPFQARKRDAAAPGSVRPAASDSRKKAAVADNGPLSEVTRCLDHDAPIMILAHCSDVTFSDNRLPPSHMKLFRGAPCRTTARDRDNRRAASRPAMRIAQ